MLVKVSAHKEGNEIQKKCGNQFGFKRPDDPLFNFMLVNDCQKTLTNKQAYQLGAVEMLYKACFYQTFHNENMKLWWTADLRPPDKRYDNNTPCNRSDFIVNTYSQVLFLGVRLEKLVEDLNAIRREIKKWH